MGDFMIQEDGFWFLDGLSREYIVVESDRLDDYITYINEKKIKAIYICNLYFFDSNIDFLNRCDFVEKINLNCDCVIDFSGIYYLKKLKSLFVNETKGKIDVSNYCLLEHLRINMKNVTGLDKLKSLKKLALWSYNPKSKDLSELSALRSLEELELIRSNINSFKGCEKLQNLTLLDCTYMSKLTNLDYLEQMKETLKILRFESCKNIQNHDYVKCLTNLEWLVYLKCGQMDTIEFIKDMPNLKNFVFMNTDVLDGNIAPCEGLEHVAFTDKKHFSHRMRDFKKVDKIM